MMCGFIEGVPFLFSGGGTESFLRICRGILPIFLPDSSFGRSERDSGAIGDCQGTDGNGSL